MYGRILVSFIESRTKTDMSEIKELAKQIAQEDIELSDVSEKSYKSSELFSQETRPIVIAPTNN